jgi:hypothetical protein
MKESSFTGRYGCSSDSGVLKAEVEETEYCCLDIYTEKDAANPQN